ncbi:MAG: methyltransferase domain-containing protein, partial [Pseudomonadota bacterium]
MRTDILDVHRFYDSPRGRKATEFIGARLVEAWGEARGLRLAGFGYASPYLAAFPHADRRLNLAPGAQGVVRWPLDGPNASSLIAESRWPLPDAAVDRLIVAHGLEEARDPARLLREAWRVLAPDGRLIVIVAHRMGLWSSFGTTPFAAGRPYSSRQIGALLDSVMFAQTQKARALFFPPVRSRLLLRAAVSWERAGARLWPWLCGVLLIEASKNVFAPLG